LGEFKSISEIPEWMKKLYMAILFDLLT